LDDLLEAVTVACLAANTADTDGDGLCDGNTSVGGVCVAGEDFNLDGVQQGNTETSPCDPDSDADGLTDGDEVLTHGTDPLSVDTDGEGLSDGDEVLTYGTDPLAVDSEGDGLDDLFETFYGPTVFTCLAGDGCTAATGCLVYTYGGHTYLFCGGTIPWTDARDFCRLHGGDLASVDSQAEQDFVKNTITSTYDNNTWIGLNDRAVEGVFAWSHGTLFGYSAWNSGQPSDAGAGLENCVQMYSGASYLWHDQQCSRNYNFVCEDGFGLNPWSADSDGDTLTDWDEVNVYLTDPNLADTDADGLVDSDELFTYNTDPNSAGRLPGSGDHRVPAGLDRGH